MKKINWYKFTIVAFSIWLVNKIASIRLGSFTPHFIAMVLFLILLATTASCSSQTSKFSTTKAPARATKLLDKKYQASRSQYTFVNNQIIIFENN
jgi:hypothetical protein